MQQAASEGETSVERKEKTEGVNLWRNGEEGGRTHLLLLGRKESFRSLSSMDEGLDVLLLSTDLDVLGSC